MKRLLICAGLSAALIAGSLPSIAADYPVNKPHTKAAPDAFDWSGFYVGGDLGYGWGSDDSSITFGKTTLTGNSKPDGFIYGGHFGAMYQYGYLVWGAQVTLLGGDLKNSVAVSGLPKGFPVVTKSDKFDFIGLAEARLGYDWRSAIGPLQPYVSGGLAVARSNTTLAVAGGGAATSANTDNMGWTIGGGIDWQTPIKNVTIGVKYNYIDLGTSHKSFAFGGGGAGIDIPSNQKINLITVPISYRF